MTTATKNKIKGIINPNNITTSIVGGLLLYFIVSGINDIKYSLKQADDSNRMLVNYVLPKIAELEKNDDKITEYAKNQFASIIREMCEKNANVNYRIDQLKPYLCQNK